MAQKGDAAMINLLEKRNAFGEARYASIRRRESLNNLCLGGFGSGLPSSFAR